MQKAIFAISNPHSFSHLYLHSLQMPYHTSIQLRTLSSKIHGRFQINQSNFLIPDNYEASYTS
jgi:hypothetical protein